MPGEIKHSARTVIRAVREAFPAQAAVQSALLAQQGLAGFEEPLEGAGGFYALYAAGQYDPEVLLAPLRASMWIEQLTHKPWPSCRGTHPFIQMASDLCERHGFEPADVAAVCVGVGPMQRMLVEPLERKRAPTVAIDATNQARVQYSDARSGDLVIEAKTSPLTMKSAHSKLTISRPT